APRRRAALRSEQVVCPSERARRPEPVRPRIGPSGGRRRPGLLAPAGALLGHGGVPGRPSAPGTVLPRRWCFCGLCAMDLLVSMKKKRP
ncbi:unnamed protein product, partial [Prorocentrum cordatum]